MLGCNKYNLNLIQFLSCTKKIKLKYFRLQFEKNMQI